LKRERGLSDVRAEQFVADLIRAAAPGAERTVWERSGTISVSQSPAAHDRIAALLAALRAHGHAELAVEVQIISGPKAVLNADGVDWQMIGAGGTGSASDHRAGSAEPRGTVRSVVERSLPAMLALIGEERARPLLEEAQSDSRTNVLQAPKVTLFNGQSARIEDSVQRPFVVGVVPGKGDKTAHKPRIAVVSEGMTIDLRPVARKDGSIELDFGLELAQIRDVETAEFPIGPGKKPIKVQVPEIHTWLLNTTVEMKAEQTLVLSIPKTGKGKKEQPPLCVLVKVTKLPAQPAAVTPQEAAKATAEPKEQARRRAPNKTICLRNQRLAAEVRSQEWRQVRGRAGGRPGAAREILDSRRGVSRRGCGGQEKGRPHPGRSRCRTGHDPTAHGRGASLAAHRARRRCAADARRIADRGPASRPEN
jgi:hypothetical protein